MKKIARQREPWWPAVTAVLSTPTARRRTTLPAVETANCRQCLTIRLNTSRGRTKFISN